MLFCKHRQKPVSHVIWSAADAAKATGGRLLGAQDWAATGVSIDTRTLQTGDLFIAIKGDASDGHAYVKMALEKGAAAVMVARAVDGLPDHAPVLMVDDTFKGMQALGQGARNRTGAKIIGVTGSVGKTGTKEMMAVAFGALGQTHYSKASHNNHWGVPLSLSTMHAGCDYGIFEMGMNHAGEISNLTQQVRPDIAIITTIEPVHIEHFGSTEAIAAAKAEIFEGMDAHGVAILNADNPHFDQLAQAARKCGVGKILSFGGGEDVDGRLVECLLASNGSRVKAVICGEEVSFTLLIAGRHIAMNAIAVLLAVSAAGGNVRKAAKALEKVEPPVGRGRRERINIGDRRNPVTLIDESYNASPVAMQAAFKVLALIDPGRGGRRIAVLGDMLELGADGARLHADLALPLQAADVNLVYTCGALMKNLHDALPPEQRGAHRATSAELAEIVPEVLVPGDVVMVKGSHGSRMDVVVETLRHLPQTRKQKKSANTSRREVEDAL